MSAGAVSGTTPMTSYEQFESDEHEWPYAVDPVDPSEDAGAVVWKGDREYLFKATDGNVYQGRYCRAMVDNAGNVDQPVWLGFDVSKGETVPLHHRSLYRGGFVGGRPGEGKTTAASNFMIQLALLDHGFLFIDPGGEEYLSLVQRLPESARDKTVVIDPTSDWRDRTIGFNFVETYFDPGEPGFKQEVESKVGAMLPMLEAEYPLMKGVAENMLRALIKAHKSDPEYDYCLIDLYFALDNTDEYAHMVEEQKLTFLQPFAEEIRDEIDDEALEPLTRRLKNWIESDLIRPLVAQRTTDLSMEKVVSEDYHVIVNCDISNPNTQRMVMTALSQLLWSVIFSRPSVMERELMELEGVDVPDIGGNPSRDGDLFKPFFFIADEFHTLASESVDLGRVLALARKKRLGIYALSQQVAQLPKDDKEAMKANTAFKLAFNPGHDESEANYLAKAMPGKDPTDFTALKRFRAITITDEAEQAFEVHMLPLYPPRRTLSEANQWFKDALEEYGHEIDDATEAASANAGRFGSFGTTTEQPATEAGEHDLSDRHIQVRTLKAIYDEAVRRDELSEHIPIAECTERICRYLETSDGVPASAVEGMTHNDVWRQILQYIPETELSWEGDDKVRVEERPWISVGTTQNDGGRAHLAPMKDAYLPFTRLGFIMEVLNQDGAALPDARCSIDDLLHVPDHTKPGDVHEIVEEFIDQNEIVHRLAGTSDVAIESEHSTGDTQPSQTVANASKVSDGQRCLFLCRPDVAPNVHRTLLEEPYGCRIHNGKRRYYTGSAIRVDGETVTRPGGRDNIWTEDRETGELVLSDKSGAEHARFGSLEAAMTDPSAYPTGEQTVTRPVVPDYDPEALDVVVVPEGASEIDDLAVYHPERENTPLGDLVVDEETADENNREDSSDEEDDVWSDDLF